MRNKQHWFEWPWERSISEHFQLCCIVLTKGMRWLTLRTLHTVTFELRVQPTLIKCCWFACCLKKWFKADSKLAERQRDITFFFFFLQLFGCNVTSVQFWMKGIHDSTPERCSHKPEESAVLFCSAPLPPYSCWLTKWQQGRIYPSLQMTHCGFLGIKAWPERG